LLLVAVYTRVVNPYRLVYDALGIVEPDEPRAKPTCCDVEGQPPIDAELAGRFEEGVRLLSPGIRSARKARGNRA
jgi:hypothetical protein